MIEVKVIEDGKIVLRQLAKKNIYSSCPKCDKKTKIKIKKVSYWDDLCLYTSRIYCKKCTKELDK